MHRGKLKKFTFVDITEENKQYKYIYLLYAKKLFKKLFFKLTFESKLPYYMFTDIMKVMRNEGYYFEDLIGTNTDLSIGTVKVVSFSSADETQYTTDDNYWNLNFFEDALSKQRNYKGEYDKKYGHPEDIGLHDAWENINLGIY